MRLVQKLGQASQARKNEGKREGDDGEYWHEYLGQLAKRDRTNELWKAMKWSWADETVRKRVTGGDPCAA